MDKRFIAYVADLLTINWYWEEAARLLAGDEEMLAAAADPEYVQWLEMGCQGAGSVNDRIALTAKAVYELESDAAYNEARI